MTRQRLAGEKRREQIISKAVALFAERGFAEVTTREIARSAKINEATIYKHFSSKEELYDDVLKYYSSKIRDRLEPVVSEPCRDLREKLVLMAGNFSKFIKQDPNIMRLMLYSGLQNHPFAESYFRSIGVDILKELQSNINSAKESGRVRQDVDAYYAAISILGMIIHYNLARNLILKKFFSDLDDEKFIEHSVDIFLNGILTRSEGERE